MAAPEAIRDMTFAEAINDALDLALATDPNVFLLGEDIADPPGGVVRLTQGLSTKYGTHRVRATPISEQAIIGTACEGCAGTCGIPRTRMFAGHPVSCRRAPGRVG